ncbi:MAG: DUF1592 domain-containing protein [Planctomycetaceae bacterium]|nr:DUF1592 domain-containing protein [Planctomycetales bacterium]MCB9921733.1 DUF1592 domain-containing protein [Planctomycetaceae bacterium]
MTSHTHTTMTLTIAIWMASLSGPFAQASGLSPESRSFLKSHCHSCHQGTDAEAGLDFDVLSTELIDDATLAKWVRVFDRVHSGEMPPADAEAVAPKLRQRFLDDTGAWIKESQQAAYELLGRVRGRRLTNLQLERSLHDLLGVDIPLATRMPEESRSDGFTTVADGQAMSHFQLEQHVTVVDAALDEAFRRAFTEPDERERLLPAEAIVRTRPRSRTREPELIDGQAVTWASRLIFYGRLPATTAKEDGWYRFTIRSTSLKAPEGHGVWCTVRTGQCVSSAPMYAWVGAFEATDQPKEVTYDAWMSKGDMLEVRPGDDTLKMARFAGGQVGTGEGGPQNVPGVAIEWIKMTRVHHGPDDEGVRRLLFDDLPVQVATKPQLTKVVSEQPKRDAVRLMRKFGSRAFRRPVEDEVLKPYIALVIESLDKGDDFPTAIRAGYRALLCSPRLLYFHEQPGKLDDYAIASRLSYLLWSRMPDDELFGLAKAGKLSDTSVIRAQVARMLADPRGEQFVRDISAQWLDLSRIDFTEPDRKLYPGFDVIVQQSMLDETHAYLQTMLDADLSISHLIDSDFTYLNSRLARFYGIDRVDGDTLRKVTLKPEDHRGGVLTQGAILKVTANGTTTSPVLRGVWVSERLLGTEIPPPPQGVPAIEPDIRGATSIREMLEKHKADAACAVCHVKIDPPGFALENYDPSGRWRDKYLAGRSGKSKAAPLIDASFEMPDGRPFKDVREFQSLVLTDKRAVARNVAEKLITYGTGASVNFADRSAVDGIVSICENADYGFRSILQAVVTSSVFLIK